MSIKNFKIPVRAVLSVATLALVIFVIYKNFGDIKEAVGHLSQTNIFVLLLLIPEQLFMYYCAGQMFFSYMAAKRRDLKISPWTLMRISFELNFVNHAIPAGGFGGLGYITWRLGPFSVTPGQASFMYALRYVITVCTNQIQTILAVLFSLIFSTVPSSGSWVIVTTLLLSFGILFALVTGVVIASSAKRIHWFSRFITAILDFTVKAITLGRKTNRLTHAAVDKYFMDFHDDLMLARRNVRTVIYPMLWGVLYSFLEVATYWVVAISLGHPELLPQIMIGEAIGSVFGAIIPYGLYELGMVGIMVSLGVDLGLASIVVLMTRVIVLANTIVSGYGFYQHAISKVGRKDAAKPSAASHKGK